MLVSPECADPLYRRSVKVSMGGGVRRALDPRRPVARHPAHLLRDNGFRDARHVARPGGGRVAARRSIVPGRVAVVLGTEGDGLTAGGPRSAATRRVRIPMAAGVDSLNVAAASAVVFYALAAGRDQA